MGATSDTGNPRTSQHGLLGDQGPVRRLILISGDRDSGKTAAASGLAVRLGATGVPVGGVLSEAFLREGLKVSYSFVDLQTGARALYAVRRGGPLPRGALAFEFLEQGLTFGRAAVRRAIGLSGGALFIDEIGPLEMSGGGLWHAAKEALEGYHGLIVLTARESLRERLLQALEETGIEPTVVSPSAAAALPL
jgi:nucleoside-triphosphatase THEP1